MIRCPDCKTMLDCANEQGTRGGAWHVETYRCERCAVAVIVETQVARDSLVDSEEA